MSVVTQIYDAIAAWTPTYDSDVTVPVKNYDEVDNTFQDANAPHRFLLYGPSPAEMEAGAFITLGKLQNLTWTIHDTLYLKASGTGVGYAEVCGKLLEYSADYVEVVRQNRAPTTQSHITSVACVPGILYWPPGDRTGTQYFGVDCVLTVQEVVSGA